MKRICISLAVGVTVGLALGSAAQAATPTLYANYTPGCTFTFVGDSGAAVTSVAPGTYQVLVLTPFAFGNGNADCDFVEFHLTGPGVNLATDLGGGDEESEQHTVTLQAGATYTVQDDARAAQTRRTFTVASAASATPTGSASTSTSSVTSDSSSKGGGTASKDLVGSAVGR